MMPEDYPLAHANIEIFDRPLPRIRYTAGLTVYDEGFANGRLVGRYWASDGQIPSEHELAVKIDQHKVLPIEAFRLEIDGQALEGYWAWAGAQEVEASPGARHCVIELRHSTRPVTVQVHTHLDGTPVFKRWLEITNTGERSAALGKVAPWAGMLWATDGYHEVMPRDREEVFTLGWFKSRTHGGEGTFAWQALPNLTTTIAGNIGLSGFAAPYFLLRNEASGEYAFGNLAWSSNWRINFQVDQDPFGVDILTAVGKPVYETAYLFFDAGPDAPAPQRVIEPGEMVATPPMHLGFLNGDLNDCVQAMHTHARRSVIPKPPAGRGHLVQMTRPITTAALGGEGGESFYVYDESRLRGDVDLAAEIGVEVFILDSGWYGEKSGDWWATVGDWFPNDLFPNGLQPIREYVREKGMLFGLWVEPEAIAAGTRIHREHPDWVVQRDGKPVFTRSTPGPINHGWLDITRPEVAAWMESEILRLIEEHELDMFRLDYNVIPVYAGGEAQRDGWLENVHWRRNEAFYRIFERVREKYPHVVLQQASGGGGRTDFGIMARYDEHQTTDRTFMPKVLRGLNGILLGFPPEILRVSAGFPWPYYHRSTLDSILRTNMVLTGSKPTNIAPSPAEFSAERRGFFTHYVALYKDFIRSWLPTCRVYHHDPIRKHAVGDDWFAIEYVSQERDRGLAMIMRLEGATQDAYRFRPRGLRAGRRYKVTSDNTGESFTLSGVELLQVGLHTWIETTFASELYLFEAE